MKCKVLSSLDNDDARDYINGFPIDPQPAGQWVMTAPRIAAIWLETVSRPLSVKSRQDALSALKKFFAELVDAQHLDHNAFAKIRVFNGSTHDDDNDRRVSAKSRLQFEHGLTSDAWRFAMRVLDAMPDMAAATRMGFVLSFAYSTGCGAPSYAVPSRTICRSATLDRSWGRSGCCAGSAAREGTLRAVGAGGAGFDRRLPEISRPAARSPRLPGLHPVNSGAAVECRDRSDLAPELVARARQAGPIHPVQLYKAIKQFFAMATAAAPREDSPHAHAFSAASPHWLRHTFVSHALANGMSLERERNFAGHDSLDTTSIYATAELSRQYREAETFLRRVTD